MPKSKIHWTMCVLSCLLLMPSISKAKYWWATIGPGQTTSQCIGKLVKNILQLQPYCDQSGDYSSPYTNIDINSVSARQSGYTGYYYRFTAMDSQKNHFHGYVYASVRPIDIQDKVSGEIIHTGRTRCEVASAAPLPTDFEMRNHNNQRVAWDEADRNVYCMEYRPILWIYDHIR